MYICIVYSFLCHWNIPYIQKWRFLNVFNQWHKSKCFVKWSSHRQDLFVCLMVLNATFNNISVYIVAVRVHYIIQLRSRDCTVLKLINSFKSTILTAKLWTLSSLILIFDTRQSKKKPRVFFTGDFIRFCIHCCVGIAGKTWGVFQVGLYNELWCR
jgi:hypothetical protein